VDPNLSAAQAAIESGDQAAYAKELEKFYSGPIRKRTAEDEDVVAAVDLIEASPPVKAEWVAHNIITTVQTNPDLWPRAATKFKLAATRARELERQAQLAETEARVALNRASLHADRIVVCTTHTVPGRDIDSVLTVIAGQCVESRSVFSDFGSDMKSGFGGRLYGIERAVESARLQALEALEEAARNIGADAVVGVDTSVQTVSDKAQLVMMVGTAVTLQPLPAVDASESEETVSAPT
jgi:uncharacterized protein YbjQ (UPF0145 family)